MGDILFLAHRVPFPPDRGDKIRSYHLLKAAAALAPVHLATFADDDADVAHAKALLPLVRSLHVEKRGRSPLLAGAEAITRNQPASVALYRSARMSAFVDTLFRREKIDAILAFSSQVAQFVPHGTDARFVMDFVDVDSAKFAAYAEQGPGPLRWLYRREAELLARYEAAVAQRADRSLFVSAAEAALFRTRAGVPGSKVMTLENGVDIESFSPDASFSPLGDTSGTPLIVFTGQMDYLPNVQAVQDFAAAFPTIRARHPGAAFAIVGRNPAADVRALGELPGVTVTGQVADVRPWLAAADVVVAPLRIARGVQNKVLEAMAMARPVVASAAAHEGIEAEAGRDLLVADGDVATRAVINLLDNPPRGAEIGAHARARIVSRYSWEERLRPLAALLGHAPVQVAA
jgi:sugar transferase (PEP-CTERM/EpsH1 system associated)